MEPQSIEYGGGIKMRILVVEDDEKLRNAIEYQLNHQGIETDGCEAGDEALYFARQQVHDVIVLDRMIPEMDGLSVLHKIRKEQIATPVIMVTAMNGVDDRIDGLEGGADDYLVKPFEMRELIARIRALCRRPNEFRKVNEMQYAGVKLNLDSKVLSTNDKSCELTVREAQLMEFFFRNQNQIIPRQTLLTRVWGNDTYVTESNLDNYIYFVRRRLKSVLAKVKISTIRGIGYRLEEM